MPAFAAIVNPAVSEDKSIVQLFYETATRGSFANLAMTLQSGTDNTNADAMRTFEADDAAVADTSSKGLIPNPSQIGVGLYYGMPTVVAVTLPNVAPTATPTSHDISMVSPVYRKLASAPLATTKVAVCNSEENNLYAFFLTGSKDALELAQYDFKDGGEPTTWLENTGIAADSCLAAYWNTETSDATVIYQSKSDDRLMEYVIEKNPVTLTTVTDVEAGANFGVVYSGKQTYLYYTNSAEQLRVVVKSESGGWGSPEFLKKTHPKSIPKVATDSQITVVHSNGINHVFYASQSSPIVHIRHPVA
ncbi:hypothetical protein F5Y18DRAFT_367535 [Xylariaceae sp. FL1019]|nr:hypothetical protein F5Y18DRAFT_367535 [Xylariaceae sp. FL1019]